MTFYTIGYGGRTQAEFLALVQPRQIRTVIDVRIRPDRASMGLWQKAKTPDKGLERWLMEAGIGYRSFLELGNPFMESEDWPTRYQELMARAGDLLCRRLDDVRNPFCLMCAEKRIAECHRLMIAEYLMQARGWTAVHLG
jgi:uncharacterized protein (DUF488 family)